MIPVPDLADLAAVTATPAATTIQCQVSEPLGPAVGALVAEATFCALEWEAMVNQNQMVTLTDEMRAYLEGEAKRRGLDIGTVYKEELAAKAELAKITPRNADLLLMADRFPAPQAWYDE